MSAMGSKTLQGFILSFKLIDMVSQLELHQEALTVELWDMPESILTELRVVLEICRHNYRKGEICNVSNYSTVLTHANNSLIYLRC